MTGYLRQADESDIIKVWQWRNHPDVRKMMYTQHEISFEEHSQWWHAQTRNLATRRLIFVEEGVSKGFISFNKLDELNKRSDWAFYAKLPAEKGIGRKMEALALEFAFSTLGLNKLCCEVLPINVGVLKLHKSFGFRVEGIFRQHVLISDEFKDVVRLALLRETWLNNNARMQSI